MLRFGGYLLRFHLASDWSRNNKQSRNFLWCSRFYGKDCNVAQVLHLILPIEFDKKKKSGSMSLFLGYKSLILALF